MPKCKYKLCKRRGSWTCRVCGQPVCAQHSRNKVGDKAWCGCNIENAETLRNHNEKTRVYRLAPGLDHPVWPDEHAHEWVRSEEVKPYPGQPHWEYVRAVSTCAVCGLRSTSMGWNRRLIDKSGKRD